MTYATLMVHVDVDGELGGRVSVAADLADRFDAHLIGIAGWAPMSVFPVEEMQTAPAPGDTHLQDMRTLLDAKGEQFCAAVGTGERRVEWRSVLDFRPKPLHGRRGPPISSSSGIGARTRIRFAPWIPAA